MALVLYLFFVLFNLPSIQAQVLRPNQLLRDGKTLSSVGQTFEMGFFSPGSSRKRYFGIWLTKHPSELVVWVANRENPIDDFTGVLYLDKGGRLLIYDREGGQVVWSAQGSFSSIVYPVAELLDSGNLIVRDAKNRLLWQSIDEPTHVMLPGMKISTNRRTGARRYISSWRSPDDPSPGNYSIKMDYTTLPRALQLSGEKGIIASTAHYNGVRFAGVPYIKPNPVLEFIIDANGVQADYSFMMKSNSTLSVLILDHDGMGQRLIIDKQTQTKKTFTYMPADGCDRFAECGPFGLCNMSNFPSCGCLEGYVPRNLRQWNQQNTAEGCYRLTVPDCIGGDGFFLMRQVRLPHLTKESIIPNMSLAECRDECAKNCSCTAYASLNVSDDRGCITWHGDLLDIRVLEAEVQDLYIRVPANLLATKVNQLPRMNEERAVDFIVDMGLVVSAAVIICIFLQMLAMKRKEKYADIEEKREINSVTSTEGADNFLYDWPAIVTATSNFLPHMKIGEGGSGVVYKGVLPDGREIAVKRLIRVSAKGLTEFSNEIKSIAKLRHRNLVSLLGWCSAGTERMVIYEFMRNKSLDTFIFDENKRAILDWSVRLDIVLGIARGLKYLHHDSGSRIIHRDLKAWNILLDEGMTPKISDFGTARIFYGDQVLDKTNEVVGTFGYMSPEYAIDGVISTKSDVFSFGVLVLEIISGLGTRGSSTVESEESLLSKAWRLWINERYADLLDSAPTGPCPTDAVLRCIQIALLCVQEQADDRPSMATVTMMLSSETFPLPKPRRPGFVLDVSADLGIGSS